MAQTGRERTRDGGVYGPTRLPHCRISIRLLSANGMVRPCSRPASKGGWQGAPDEEHAMSRSAPLRKFGDR
jgi:hypothetical protein